MTDNDVLTRCLIELNLKAQWGILNLLKLNFLLCHVINNVPIRNKIKIEGLTFIFIFPKKKLKVDVLI